jgi:hypothetical protein
MTGMPVQVEKGRWGEGEGGGGREGEGEGGKGGRGKLTGMSGIFSC